MKVVLAIAAFGLGVAANAYAATPSDNADPADITEGSIPALPATKHITWAEVAKWPDFTTGLWVTVGGPAGLPGGPPPGAGAPPAGPGGPPGGPGLPAGPAASVFGQLDGAPLKPEYSTKIQSLLRREANGGASCEPAGLPARDIAFFSPHFYYARDTIIIGAWSDWYNGWRRIHMDRTEHGHPEPTYMGDSVGHWEGNTLVIDTVAIRSEAQLFRGVPLDSDATHIVERIRLLNPNTLEWTKTIENPEILTAPWTTTITKTRKLNEDFAESYCWRDLENGIAQ